MSKITFKQQTEKCSTNFETLIKYMEINIKQEVLLNYLSNQFDFMSCKEDNINFLTFANWMELPLPISQRIFAEFTNSTTDTTIAKTVFVKEIAEFYQGSIESQMTMVFNLFDYNGDLKILIEDVKILYAHLFTHMNGINKERGLALIDVFFANNKTMTFKQFIETTQKSNSDLFYLFAFLLLSNKPFGTESLQFYSSINNADQAMSSIKKCHYEMISEPSEEFYDFLLEAFKMPFNANNDMQDLDEFEYSLNECRSLLVSPIKLPRNKLQPQSLNLSQNSISTSESSHDHSEQSKPFTTDFRIIAGSQQKKYKMFIINKDLYIFKKDHSNYVFKQIIPLKQVYCSQGTQFEEITNRKTKAILYPFHIISTVSPFYKDSLIYFDTLPQLLKVKEAIETTTNQRRFEDHYTIKTQIDHGAYGKVFTATNNKTGKVYAVKAMSKMSKQIQSESLTEICWEAYISLFLKSHPHKGIVQIEDIFESLDTVYIIQEYIETGNLFKYLSHNKSAVSSNELYLMFTQVIDSVYHLKQYGIVHRDLKLENILLEKSNDSLMTKLIDFGISRVVLTEEKMTGLNGTFSYLPPEMIKHESYSANIDVWTIGLIGYIMLYDYNPYKDDSIEKMMKRRQMIRLTFPKITDDIKKIALRTLIMYCMDSDQYHRPSIESIHQMMENTIIVL